MRVLLLSTCMFFAACSHGDSVDRGKCTELRDHLIDLRLASATGSDDMDLAPHRAAMKQALGEKFLADCEQHLTIEQLRCDLKATDLSATKDCERVAASSH